MIIGYLDPWGRVLGPTPQGLNPTLQSPRAPYGSKGCFKATELENTVFKGVFS